MELSTVSELAKKHGHHQGVRVSEDNPHSPAHCMAEVIHGWVKHKNDTGEEVRMTDEDYLSAIEAAKLGQDHAPANMRS